MPCRPCSMRALASLAVLAAACTSPDAARGNAAGISGGALISDQLHSGGTNGFVFLPPMVPTAGGSGVLVPHVPATVRIDELQAGGTFRTLATFTATTGPEKEHVRFHGKGG